MMNTSQDPDYEGPTGFEKKMHKTHFHMLRELRHVGPCLRPRQARKGWEWVRIGESRYKLIRSAAAGAYAPEVRNAIPKQETKNMACDQQASRLQEVEEKVRPAPACLSATGRRHLPLPLPAQAGVPLARQTGAQAGAGKGSR